MRRPTHSFRSRQLQLESLFPPSHRASGIRPKFLESSGIFAALHTLLTRYAIFDTAHIGANPSG